MSLYTEVGWASDGTHPLSQANMKKLDAGIVAAHDPLSVAEVTAGTSASLTLTVPAGVEAVRIVGVFRTSGAVTLTNLRVSPNDYSASNAYRWIRKQTVGDGTVNVAFQVADAHWQIDNVVPGSSATAAEFGQIDLLIPSVTSTQRKRMVYSGGVLPTTTAADAFLVQGQGRSILTAAVTSVVLRITTGSFETGSRFELRYA